MGVVLLGHYLFNTIYSEHVIQYHITFTAYHDYDACDEKGGRKRDRIGSEALTLITPR